MIVHPQKWNPDQFNQPNIALRRHRVKFLHAQLIAHGMELLQKLNEESSLQCQFGFVGEKAG
jgi:hypothetical protein